MEFGYVRVRCVNGVNVDTHAIVCGAWAAHQTVGAGRTWDVTHVQSGRRLPPPLIGSFARRDAVAVAVHLNETLGNGDWDNLGNGDWDNYYLVEALVAEALESVR